MAAQGCLSTSATRLRWMRTWHGGASAADHTISVWQVLCTWRAKDCKTWKPLTEALASLFMSMSRLL